MAAFLQSFHFKRLVSKKNLTVSDTDLKPGEVQVRSSSIPQLKAGKYGLGVQQDISNSTSKQSLKSWRILNVQTPKFTVPEDEVHSVYPHPDASAAANTLPHVVFNQPTYPWEVDVGNLSQENKHNSIPWVALLVFAQDELSTVPIKINGKDPSLTNTRAVSLPAKVFRELHMDPNASEYATFIDGEHGNNGDYLDSDMLNAIFIESKTFQSLFGTYQKDQPTPSWTGTPDLDRYSFLAHIRKVNTADMYQEDELDSLTRTYGVVFSHKLAPEVQEATTVTTHLVSLEGVKSINLTETTKKVGLISLHSWNWTCLPRDKATFTELAKNLTSTIQPLNRIKQNSQKSMHILPFEEPQKLDFDSQTKQEEADSWLESHISEGYMLLPHILPTGEETVSLYRGPLSPVKLSSDRVMPWSLFGTDLQVVDKETAIIDVSFDVAWQFGKILAASDSAFSTSLLRLRGSVHKKALQAAQATLYSAGTFQGVADTLRDLTTSLNGLNNAGGLGAATAGTAAKRWMQSTKKPYSLESISLSSKPTLQQYIIEIESSLRGAAATIPLLQKEDAAITGPMNTNSTQDWDIVMGWVLDKLFLKDLLPLYLVPDPLTLPPESIRTFYIDPCWIECMIDGALSLANHYQDDDDAFRRMLKENINVYLRLSTIGAGSPHIPQIPRWGFLIRSFIISSLPDLEIIAPLPEGSTPGAESILLRKRLADDVLIILFDRVPEDNAIGDIVFKQPPHQQSFQCGKDLDPQKLDFVFHYLPNVPGKSLADLGEEKHVEFIWENSPVGNPTLIINHIFDWKNRCLIFPNFGDVCMKVLQKDGIADWSGYQGSPSSVVATQLNRSVLSFGLTVTTKESLKAFSIKPYQLQVPKIERLAPPSVTPLPNGPEAPHINLPETLQPTKKLGLFKVAGQPLLNPSDIAVHDLAVTGELEKFPFILNVWPLMQTKGSPVPFHANSPIDLVFELKWQKYKVNSMKIYIPVGASLTDLYSITPNPQAPQVWGDYGAVKSPLPNIQALGKGLRWRFGHELSTDSKNQVYFVVKITPRGTNYQNDGRDASFLLKKVRLTGFDGTTKESESKVWVHRNCETAAGNVETLISTVAVHKLHG